MVNSFKFVGNGVVQLFNVSLNSISQSKEQTWYLTRLFEAVDKCRCEKCISFRRIGFDSKIKMDISENLIVSTFSNLTKRNWFLFYFFDRYCNRMKSTNNLPNNLRFLWPGIRLIFGIPFQFVSVSLKDESLLFFFPVSSGIFGFCVRRDENTNS